MKNIATLTLNPAIDVSCTVPRMVHTHKMRTADERHDPGGGGINVARVFVRLGGDARCYYFSGGATGVALDALLDRHQIVRRRIPIGGDTRVAMSAFDEETGKEYRFVPAGPVVTAAECEMFLEALSDVACEVVVASGSLPRGAPIDFYVRVAATMRSRGVKFVLDTSGEALKATLNAGGVHLVKPSLGELSSLCGRELTSIEETSAAAMEIVRAGQAEMVAVTMGHRGAILARDEGALFLPAVPVEPHSAVGAGDSFLAAMVHALVRGWEPVSAFRYGIAAGAAAVLNSGAGLAHEKDIERLFAQVPEA